VSLFFALWPDAELRRQIVERRDQLSAEHRGVSGAWFASDAYHLTVQDLSLQADRIDAAIAAAAAVQAEAFELVLDHAAGFRSPRGADRWMLIAKQAAPGLRELRRELLGRLRAQGLAPKPSTDKPHLTLHYKAGRELAERRIEALAWSVREFVLLQGADQAGRGFHYRVLGSWPLAAGRDRGHAPQLDLWDNPG
jgi:RNA 2',3'-cyclic 3'-phosphodiesterase